MSAPKGVTHALLRVGIGIDGFLSFVAVIVAVEYVGWWAVPAGVAAMFPGALFIIAAVVGWADPDEARR